MGSGNSNSRTSGRIFNLKYIQFYTFCRTEILSANLLVLSKNGICLSEIDTDIVALGSLNNTGNNVSFLCEVSVVEGLSFLFTDFLYNYLLCLLCSNTAKVLWSYFDIDDITNRKFLTWEL